MGSSLNVLRVGGGSLLRTESGLRFLNPPGRGDHYTAAQIDDYQGLPRAEFPWSPPLRLAVRARFSHGAGELAGTAGFGFWNDPFLMTGLRMPALPQALWFFYASAPSNMALAVDVPGRGWKAACIDARHGRGAAALPLALLAAPAMQSRRAHRRLWPYFSRAWRIGEALLPVAMTEWHTYVVEWEIACVRFFVDGRCILTHAPAPAGPLGLVVWLDNQYLVVRPTGRSGYGRVPRPAAQWMEVESLLLAPR